MPAFSASADDRLRNKFRAVYVQAERGQLSPSSSSIRQFEDYVLYADLLAAAYKARLSKETHPNIAAFLDEYEHLGVVQRLRRTWLRRLASGGHWQTYLEAKGEQTAAKYLCHELTARLRMGQTQDLIEDALPLWMVGKSQDKACDPAFEYLAFSGELTETRLRARMLLALQARELKLARYLSKSLPAQDSGIVSAWEKMRGAPGQELITRQIPDSPQGRALLSYGIERLARKDPFYAQKLWDRYVQSYSFLDETKHNTSRYIAKRAALKNHPSALALFSNLDAQAQNEETGQWRVRLSLGQRNWVAVLAAIDAMPVQEQNLEGYRYWKARASHELGDSSTAELLYSSLASERSYYGFLAADRIGRPYNLNHRPAKVDESALIALEKKVLIQRARELFAIGFYSLGRSAWNEAVASLDTTEKEQAAVLAHRWGWHSRAIAQASAHGLIDDLTIRYPLAHRDLIVKKAANKNIDATWAYGIARSESLFMSDVVSRAGAMGLMQVMPATGKSVARRHKIPYRSWRSLLNPSTNVSLGTTYLSEMSNRFGGNTVLASAAYNAGPHRVQRWLPGEATEADVWVDTIPFKETRHYVQRVMAAQIIFHWRLNGTQTRLASTMDTIQPAASANKGSNSIAAF
ncbi:MAG: transglycosylase SLT domain-containing protein [Pseudomonadota bacterium]